MNMGKIEGAAQKAGNRIEKSTGCGFLPQVVQFMGKGLEQGINNKAQEFYSYVMPPIDMQKENNVITVSIDLPGFKKEEITVKLDGNTLWLNAKRAREETEATIIRLQRPNKIEKHITIPARIKRGEEPECSTTLQDGVLVLNIPIPDSGKEIIIE